MWKDGLKAAGLGNRLLHDLRRTCVRRMAAAGIDDEIGIEITGHKSLRIYGDYKAITETDKLAAVRKMEAARKKAKVKATNSVKAKRAGF